MVSFEIKTLVAKLKHTKAKPEILCLASVRLSPDSVRQSLIDNCILLAIVQLATVRLSDVQLASV